MNNLIKYRQRSLFGLVLIIVLTVFIRLGYLWEWTGFNYHLEVKDQVSGKYLWDWLELLIVPVVLLGLGVLFNFSQRKSELEIAENERAKDRELAEKSRELQQAIETDRLRESILQTYFDKMSDLMAGIKNDNDLQNDLLNLKNIGRARTLTIVRQLDPERKGFVIRFLAEAKLIESSNPIIKLEGCDLSDIRIEKMNIPHINLSGVDLSSAQIYTSNLIGSDLSNTVINKACISDSLLQKVNFSNAKIVETQIVRSSLAHTNFQDAEIVQSTVVDSVLLDAKFRNASLVQPTLIKCDLSQAQINETKKIVEAELPEIGRFSKLEN